MGVFEDRIDWFREDKREWDRKGGRWEGGWGTERGPLPSMQGLIIVPALSSTFTNILGFFLLLLWRQINKRGRWVRHEWVSAIRIRATEPARFIDGSLNSTTRITNEIIAKDVSRSLSLRMGDIKTQVSFGPWERNKRQWYHIKRRNVCLKSFVKHLLPLNDWYCKSPGGNVWPLFQITSEAMN